MSVELTREMCDRAYQSVQAMAKTKHEKRFYELFKDHTPVECARILVDEERARWEDAIAWMFQLRDNLTDAIHQLRVAYDDERKPGGK